MPRCIPAITSVGAVSNKHTYQYDDTGLQVPLAYRHERANSKVVRSRSSVSGAASLARSEIALELGEVLRNLSV